LYIDWKLAEEKPESKQKVEGKFLLDLRTKVNDLERELTQKKKELEETFTEIANLNKNIKYLKEDNQKDKKLIEEVHEKFMSASDELFETKKQEESLNDQIKVLNESKSELENRNKGLEEKKNTLEKNIEDLKNKLTERAEEISHKDKEINDHVSEINTLKEEIEKIKTENLHILADKDNEIENMKSKNQELISEKEQEIEKIKLDLKAQLYDIDELKQKNIENDIKLEDSKKILEVMDQINEKLLVKGFITDKELEQILH